MYMFMYMSHIFEHMAVGLKNDIKTKYMLLFSGLSYNQHSPSIYHNVAKARCHWPQTKNSTHTDPDSKVHGANMGPIWGRQDPGGPHVGPMNFAVWGAFLWKIYTDSMILPWLLIHCGLVTLYGHIDHVNIGSRNGSIGTNFFFKVHIFAMATQPITFNQWIKDLNHKLQLKIMLLK